MRNKISNSDRKQEIFYAALQVEEYGSSNISPDITGYNLAIRWYFFWGIHPFDRQ